MILFLFDFFDRFMYTYYTLIEFYTIFLQNYVKIKKSKVLALMIMWTSLFYQFFTGYHSQKKLEKRKQSHFFNSDIYSSNSLSVILLPNRYMRL